jgi:hypothetical protein
MYFYMFFNFGPIIERKLKSETFFEKFRKTDFFEKIEYLTRPKLHILNN